jgi:hypothetical protein
LINPPPSLIRGDMESQFVADTLRRWSKNNGTMTVFIEQG